MAAIIGPISGEISMLEARKIVLFSTRPKLARTLKWIVDRQVSGITDGL